MLYSSDDFQSAPREKYTERVSRCSFAQKTREQKRPPLLFARASEKMCRPFPLKFGGKSTTRSRHSCAALADAAVSLSLSLSLTRQLWVEQSQQYMQNLRACAANLRVFTRTQPRGERRRKARTRRRICPRRQTNIRNRIREMMTSRDREGWWQSLFNANNFNWARARFVPVGGAFYVCAVPKR